MNIYDIMQLLVDKEGSDIHLIYGIPPVVRIDGELIPVEGAPILGQQELELLIMPLMNDEQKKRLHDNKEFDFGYQFGEQGRFRVNVYMAKGQLSACMRLIPTRIKSMEELNLPEVFSTFTTKSQGLILVTGPTGEGKSTTLAALIDRINATRNEHILTIEDPIEFVYQPKKSIVSQRELNDDTHDWNMALRSALREDPDIVLVGEMRDYETIASAITVAETGHLVFATLHTSTAAQTIDRIIDVFPAHQQGQIRQQLAATLEAVVSQRLLPRVGGGRIAAFEIMVTNGAIKNLIREGKTYQIDNTLQTSAGEGNILIENHLATLVQQGQVTREDAMRIAFRPDQLQRLLGGGSDNVQTTTSSLGLN
jgi:twitching motility protein PilT